MGSINFCLVGSEFLKISFALGYPTLCVVGSVGFAGSL